MGRGGANSSESGCIVWLIIGVGVVIGWIFMVGFLNTLPGVNFPLIPGMEP